MKKILDWAWPVVGLLAVAFSFWLIYKEVRGISANDVVEVLYAIPPHRYALAFLATLFAYFALAWYDRIALLHLGRTLSWMFISVVSFTTYAISHNIGASVFSGAMVRYRAYSTKGLSVGEVAVLVAFCSFTFALGMVLIGGVVLTFEPELVLRLFDVPEALVRGIGIALLTGAGLYFLGSVLNLPPLVIRSFRLEYPRLPVAIRQFVAAPIEIIGAAAIIYFALPEAGNPGFFIVLGVFVLSFSAALLSHAPGGLGVLEFVFLKALPEIPPDELLAALIVFRVFYLLLPLFMSAFVVLAFERSRLAKAVPSAPDAR